MNPFNDQALKRLAQILAEHGTGREISDAFESSKNDIHEVKPQTATKWLRIYSAFQNSQQATSYNTGVLVFIKNYLSKERFTFAGGAEKFNDIRGKINMVLQLDGLEYTEEGKFQTVKKSLTLSDSERRANVLRDKFNQRNIHPEVMKYCQAEYLNEDHHHVVFEACKGLCQRIRDMSGMAANGDGVLLVRNMMDRRKGQPPRIQFTDLLTETDRNVHDGIFACSWG